MAEVCLVLTGPRLADCARQLTEHRAWIDLAELRADLLEPAEWPALAEFSRQVDLPLILTLRQLRDGGRWSGTPAERQAFFEAALEGAWTWLDLEDDQPLPQIEAAWLRSGRSYIRSFHAFTGVPKDWAARVQQLTQPGVIPKAAVQPRNSQEYEQFVTAALALPPGERILLAMGGFGFSSRILAERLGSRWTYTSPRGQVAAPGQTDPETLNQLFRFRQQTATTPVYGLIGNPVFHSRSPLIHNSGLTASGLPGVYIPFLVDDLPAFLATARQLGVQGLSCTIPFKEAILAQLQQTEPAVAQIGACNTLWPTTSGWAGDNTDAPGFLEPLRTLWQNNFAGKTATVIGTGGAARGVVWALRQVGVEVLILGRSPEKACALAQEFGAAWGPLGPDSRSRLEAHRDAIIQTTSVGMGESAGQNPLAWYAFQGTEVAYDIIYAPQWTAFLSQAQAAGCRLLFGKDMLIHQAFGQFRRFTGQDYPRSALPTSL